MSQPSASTVLAGHRIGRAVGELDREEVELLSSYRISREAAEPYARLAAAAIAVLSVLRRRPGPFPLPVHGLARRG